MVLMSTVSLSVCVLMALFCLLLSCALPCIALLHHIAAIYVVDWLQCNHGNVVLTSVFICVLANHLPPQLRLFYFIALCLGSCLLKWAGLSAISHHLTDSSISYTDSIRCALQTTILIACTRMPLHICVRVFVCQYVEECVCSLKYMCTLLSVLSCLSGLLFSCGPIHSSISCRLCLGLCAPENERGMSLVHSY